VSTKTFVPHFNHKLWLSYLHIIWNFAEIKYIVLYCITVLYCIKYEALINNSLQLIKETKPVFNAERLMICGNLIVDRLKTSLAFTIHESRRDVELWRQIVVTDSYTNVTRARVAAVDVTGKLEGFILDKRGDLPVGVDSWTTGGVDRRPKYWLNGNWNKQTTRVLT